MQAPFKFIIIKLLVYLPQMEFTRISGVDKKCILKTFTKQACNWCTGSN